MNNHVASEIALEEDRKITINNMSVDIFKIENALMSITDLSPEGEVIREDLLGLLHFNSDSYVQVDALMIERHRAERRIESPTSENTQRYLQ